MSQQDPMLASVMASAKERDALIASNTKDNTSANIGALIQGGVNLLTQKKRGLKDFNKSVLKEEQKIYDKVGGFSSEYEGFNAKSETFFDGLIGKYNEIKTHLDSGTMKDASLGKKDLANIKNLIDQYGSAIPKVLASADAITDAANIASKDGMGAPGTLSVTGAPPGQLAIIKKISSGGPAGEEIDLRHEGGTIVLYDTVTGAELNIREFNKVVTDKKNPYIKYVPNLTKGMTNAFDSFNKNSEGNMIDTFTQPKGDGPNPIRTMSVGKETELKEALMGSKRFDYTTNKVSNYRDGGGYKEMINQYGESIWEDMMPDGLTNDTAWPEVVPMFGDPKYDTFYTKYYEPMLDYLATTTINNNTQDIQRESQTNPEERKAPKEEKAGIEKYNAKLDEYFSRVGLSDEDQEKMKIAEKGDVVEVILNGKLTKIRKK